MSIGDIVCVHIDVGHGGIVGPVGCVSSCTGRYCAAIPGEDCAVGTREGSNRARADCNRRRVLDLVACSVDDSVTGEGAKGSGAGAADTAKGSGAGAADTAKGSCPSCGDCGSVERSDCTSASINVSHLGEVLSGQFNCLKGRIQTPVSHVFNISSLCQQFIVIVQISINRMKKLRSTCIH